VIDSSLVRARSGDERAFGELVEPHRRELLLHCYRLLGSSHDAEDVLQETFVAAWRGLAGFEERASLRTWLYRIATNRCLNALRDATRRPVPVPPFEPPAPTRSAGPTGLHPLPDQALDARETLELAFMVGLQQLPPRQRAALVLRDVLDFGTGEAAAILDTTPTAVKAALQRARATLAEQRSAPGRRPHRPSSSAAERDLARRFAAAFQADDIAGVIALLTDDAWLTMPPAPHEYQGPAAIAAFLTASATWRGDRRFVLHPAAANGQPAFAGSLHDPRTGTTTAAGSIVLTVDGDRICTITRFLDGPLRPDA